MINSEELVFVGILMGGLISGNKNIWYEECNLVSHLRLLISH